MMIYFSVFNIGCIASENLLKKAGVFYSQEMTELAGRNAEKYQVGI